jgi:TP901 family phage tail tape measure protein
MGNNKSNFQIMLQAILNKSMFIANIKSEIKAIESKLPKVMIQSKLDKMAAQKELDSKIKSVKTKVKVDADTTQAEKKIKKIEKQESESTITPTVDNTQVASGLKQAQKETKTSWERFTSNIIGSNLVRMAVQNVTQAIRDALSTVKELDTIKTNIQIASGTSDSRVNAMMSSYNAMAKDLSTTTKDVAEVANELLCMGESIANTNELIRSSQILSKVGMIESADAASYLISGLKGYQVAAEDSINIVSKLTSVDQKAEVSAGGLAEAISRCSNIANNSGTSMDRLIGYTAAVGEATQESMSVIGDAFKSIYSRMNNIIIGRFIDEETGESLSDTEAELNKLGIQLRDATDTYRDFDDVLSEIGTRWQDFTQVEQDAISMAVAGTMQRNRFLVLMDNWVKALEYSEVAADSAGSALERYGVYQDSLEAKTNELTAAMESLFTNTISEDLYSGIIEATTNIVELLDKFNLLKASLAGLVTLGVSKVIASISAAFIAAAKSTEQFSKVMKLLNKERSDENLLAVGAACKGLSDRQLKLVLSTKGLGDAQRSTILEGMGLEMQEQKQKLATLGLAAAEDKAVLSTLSLKQAFHYLWATNPMSLIITGITIATSIISTLFSTCNQKLEETLRKAVELTEVYKQQQSSLNSQIEKYKELKESLDMGNLSADEARSIKEQLLEIQNSLIESYGNEASNIDLVNGKYHEQLGLLNELSKEKAADVTTENFAAFEEAKKVLDKQRSYKVGSLFTYDAHNGMSDAQKQMYEFIRLYSELFDIRSMYDISKFSSDDYTPTLFIKADADNIDSTLRQFEKEIQDFVDTNGLEIDLGALKTGIADALTDIKTDKALNEAKAIYDEYLKAEIFGSDTLRPLYQQSIQAVEDYNKALSSGEGVTEAKTNLDSLQQSVHNATGTLEGSQDIFDDIYEGINKNAEAVYNMNLAFGNNNIVRGYAEQLRGLSDIDLQAINYGNDNTEKGEEAFRGLMEVLGLTVEQAQCLIDKLVELGYVQGEVPKQALEKVNTLSTRLTISQESLDKFQSSIKSAADAYTTLLSGGYSSSELLDSIQAINQAVRDMGGTLDWDFIADQSQMDSLELLGMAIGHISEKYAESVLSGAGIDVNSDFGKMLVNIIEQTYEAEAAFTGMNAQLDHLQSSYQTLKGILESYNETGDISLDNLQSLLTADENLIAMLEVENGRLTINQAAYENLVAVQLMEFKAKLDAAAAAEIEALAKGKSKEATDNNAKASEDAVAKLDAETQALTRNTKAAGNNAITKAIAKAKDVGVQEEEIQGVLDKYTEIWNAAMNHFNGDFPDFMGGTKSAAKAGASAGKAAGESFEDALKDELSNLNSVVSYIGDVIGDQIDLLEEQKDATVEALEAEKEAAEEALEAEKELIQGKIDAKQAEIDAIEEAAEARKDELDLQKAQYELERMQNQRTILQYSESKGMHYVTDTKEIREAKEAVTEAEENIRTAGMEKEISGLNDAMDILDRKIEESDKYYDSLIDQAEKYWDSLIKGLEDYKLRWQELTEIEDHAKMETALRNLGITTDNILSLSESAFQSFKGSYLGLLNEMYSGNDGMINMLREFGGIPADALSALSGTFSDAADSLDRFAGRTGTAAAAVQSVSGALNEVAGADISSPIGQFDALGSSVDNTAASISGGTAPKAGVSGGFAGKDTPNAKYSSGSGSGSLVSSIEKAGETTAEVLGEPDGDGAIGSFGRMGGVIAEAGSHVEGIIDGLIELDGMAAECTIVVNVETRGGVPAYAEGTAVSDAAGSMDLNSSRHKAEYSGSVHVTGAANVVGNWGVSNPGRSLVGELGQEIWIHAKDGRFETVGDHGAEFINTEKGDIIFNHLQTQELLKRGRLSGRGKIFNGKAYINGINDVFVTPDGNVLTPPQPGDCAWDLQQKFKPLVGRILNGQTDIASSAMFEHQKQMEQMIKNISYSNAVTNIANSRNIQPVVNNTIHVTMPNVTNSTSAETLMRDLQTLSIKKFQVDWNR